jgi:hypothetical protein
MAAIQAQLRLCSLRGILSLSLGFLALIPGLAEAQFLSRDFRQLWANEVFENYGRNGYRDYDFEQENRRFDIFGDLLIDGVDILEYNEVRRDAPGLTGSYETRSGRYEGFFSEAGHRGRGLRPLVHAPDHRRPHPHLFHAHDLESSAIQWGPLGRLLAPESFQHNRHPPERSAAGTPRHEA